MWTIKLREGITFHDGTALDATVVKNNLDAYRGKYPGREPLLFVFVFQDIASVDVVDPLTVDGDDEAAVGRRSRGSCGAAAGSASWRQAQLDSTSCNDDLIGTGPFTKDSWTVNDAFVAEKNPNYWAQGRRRQPAARTSTRSPTSPSRTNRPASTRSRAVSSHAMHTSSSLSIEDDPRARPTAAR